MNLGLSPDQGLREPSRVLQSHLLGLPPKPGAFLGRPQASPRWGWQAAPTSPHGQRCCQPGKTQSGQTVESRAPQISHATAPGSCPVVCFNGVFGGMRPRRRAELPKSPGISGRQWQRKHCADNSAKPARRPPAPGLYKSPGAAARRRYMEDPAAQTELGECGLSSQLFLPHLPASLLVPLSRTRGRLDRPSLPGSVSLLPRKARVRPGSGCIPSAAAWAFPDRDNPSGTGVRARHDRLAPPGCPTPVSAPAPSPSVWAGQREETPVIGGRQRDIPPAVGRGSVPGSQAGKG